MGCRRFATLGQYFGIYLFILEPVDQFARYQFRISGRVHTYLSQHLMDDDFDMLIVDVNPLRAVNLLHFICQVLLYGITAQDAQQLLGINGAVGQLLAGFNFIPVLDPDVGGSCNSVFPFFLLFIGDARRSPSTVTWPATPEIRAAFR